MAEVAAGKRPSRMRDPKGVRGALIQAGVQLFEEQERAATSVQSFVDAAGLTKGAFCHHFESTDDLLRRVHEEFIGHQLRRARSAMSKPGLTPNM